MVCVGYDHDNAKIRLANNSRRPRDLYFLFDRSKEILSGMQFDCVSLVDVLYAIPREDWPATLAFARECLKPGGTLLLKETIDKPAWKYRLCLFQEHLAIKVLGYTKGQAPTLPSGDVYRRLLLKSGFHLEEDLSLDKGYLWPHHLFMARKV
jgi:cyclopropane fatty-acyl-phospholipid synthase-like methyltransferase